MASELPVTAPAGSDAWTGLFNLSDPAAVNALAGNIFLAVVLLLVLAALYRLAPRAWKAVEETLFSNWRLGLLAATATGSVPRLGLDDLGRHAQFHARAACSR